MNKDNRVLYNVGIYKYTVSDVDMIYQKCKVSMENYDLNDLKLLYDSFQIKPKNKLMLSTREILEDFSEKIAIITKSGDIENIRKEVKKCRRKFYYWADLPTYIYFINEELGQHHINKRLKDDIEINKDYYDSWIAYACYKVLVAGTNDADERIEYDKLYIHKLDWEYTRALEYFSKIYEIGYDLEISIDDIFHNIYKRIQEYGSLSFYKQIYKELYRNYDGTEKRIRINNQENTELPTLLIYAIRALSINKEEVENIAYLPDTVEFRQILMDTKNAIKLLDVNNEHNLEFLLSVDEDSYLKRIMNYSSVYDIHQYVPEGMLFLIQRIIDAYSEQLAEYYGCDGENLCNIISRLVRNAHHDFVAGRVSQIPFKSICSEERNVLELMAARVSLNDNFVIPTQWNEVFSDSEWIIKRHDAYYVIPPVVSMLGVYDKIGKALNWADFGPQIEKAVLDLFRNITGLKEFSGKYVFENQVCECDAVIVGTEYALIIECKRKGISRTSRGGTVASIVRDIAETYFSSQSQAYRMQRAIELLGKQVQFYPAKCDISIKESHNVKYNKYKKQAVFMTVKHFIRISCTGGNFWIASEGGIADHIENHIREYKTGGKNDKVYIDKFLSERDKLLALKCCEYEKRIIKLDRLFVSFDKLYDIVMTSPRCKEGGDALLKDIWALTRIQSKQNDTTNHLPMLMNLNNR